MQVFASDNVHPLPAASVNICVLTFLVPHAPEHSEVRLFTPACAIATFSCSALHSLVAMTHPPEYLLHGLLLLVIIPSQH